ncbi:MAG: AAA family ATPase, partial [Pigmentiphaga sp.]
MMGPRLKSIVIENFRSLRGKIAVPLDAQVVLIHGTNGMGKTSILSAIELGLTGKVAHLSAQGENYKSYLTNLGSDGGMISLATTAPLNGAGATDGALTFTDQHFKAQPLLRPDEARFFSERSYLPQATLGRLLEIYDEHKVGTTSPLTLFVKELLGLDPLDALVDGLDPAFHVSRVRRIAPDYRHLEELKQSLLGQISASQRTISAATEDAERRLTRLNAMLAEMVALAGSTVGIVVTASTDLADLSTALKVDRDQDGRLTELSRQRSDLRGLLSRWQALPVADKSRDQANKRRADQIALEAMAAWRAEGGAMLEKAVDEVRALFPDVPSLEEGPERSHSEALRRAAAEEARCAQLLKRHSEAIDFAEQLRTVEQRARNRIDEINRDLAGAVKDAKTLANALAGIVPHILDETCPVCDRDFSDQQEGPLSAHVAAKIAILTSEAGRLQALATERADENRRLVDAQRDLLASGSNELSSEDFAEYTVRQAKMADLSRRLRDLSSVATQGALLMATASAARHELTLAVRSAEQSVSLLPEVQEAVLQATSREVSTYPSIDQAIKDAIHLVDSEIDRAERLAVLRSDSLTEVERRVQDIERIRDLNSTRERNTTQLEQVKQALKEVDATRTRAKLVSEAAGEVRSAIIKKVFSTSLNRTWRDLFVRLAPSEQFVPAFRLPSDRTGKVEA